MPYPILVKPSYFTSVQELIPTKSGTVFSSPSLDRNYVRKFRVKVKPEKKDIGAGMVCRAPGLPFPYSPYIDSFGIELDQTAVCVNISAEREDPNSYENWIVTCTYSTQVPEGGIPSNKVGLGSDEAGAQNQPWLERPVVEWDWDETTYYPSRDLDGKPYVNSAQMPFNPAPGFPAARQVLVLTRNEPFWDRTIAARYAFAVNSDVFLGAKPGTVQSLPPRVAMLHRGTLTYYRVVFRLRFNLPKRYERLTDNDPPVRPGDPDPNDLQSWQPEILDQGTHQLPAVFGVPYAGRPIPVIRYGAPTTRDVLLDGLGREAKKNPATGRVEPKFLKFREFHSAPFRPIVEGGIGLIGERPIGGV